MRRLITEVQAINPHIDACDIKGDVTSLARFCALIKLIYTDAAYTYYKTQCQENSLRERGKSDDRKIVRRRRERLLRVSIDPNPTYPTTFITACSIKSLGDFFLS